MGAHISRKYFKISKPQPDTEHCHIPSPLLTWSHSSCTHQDTTGSVGGNSQQEVYHPFRACRSSAPSTLSSAFSSLFSISAQWRSAISTTLIQSQPACQSRQDTTPTAILSPLITYTVSPRLFSSTFSIFFLRASISSPSLSLFSLSPLSFPSLSIHLLFCGSPHFYLPLSHSLRFSSSPLSAFPRLFSSLALSLPLLSFGRKAAQAQGNGINFHSRLNSQSISLELNTLPPIRKSQGSISPFPRRHSPAIQRQPRQPCLTFWRCMGGDWTGAPACCSFLQTVQRT